MLRGGVRGEKIPPLFPSSTSPTPNWLIFWLQWLGSVQCHRGGRKGHGGWVLVWGCARLDSRCDHLRASPAGFCDVWWAPGWRHSSAMETLVSKRQHFNTVTNSQPQQGTRFGKQRQLPTNLVLEGSRLHRHLAKKVVQKSHLWGNWLGFRVTIQELQGIKKGWLARLHWQARTT